MSLIDQHLERFDEPQRGALAGTVATIRTALPGATEVISYGMPTFKVGGEKGIAVIGLEGFAAHNSLFPYSGQVPTEFAGELAGRVQTKGSIHFDLAKPFPAALLKRILRARIREINEGFPKKTGEFREYYDNGFPKVAGRIRGGVKVGDWTTYDRSGAVRKVTRYA
jgi:uncharacterized protein YdhG (YjbR/CyaY superfamily)